MDLQHIVVGIVALDVKPFWDMHVELLLNGGLSISQHVVDLLSVPSVDCREC